jgi:hypothetical protein
MKQIHFAVFESSRQQLEFLNDQDFAAGYPERRHLTRDIVDKLLPISDRSNRIVVDSAEN